MEYLNIIKEYLQTIMMIIGLSILLLSNTMADDPHGAIKETVTNNYYDSKGIASAISAAQCHFDNGSFHLQLCAGAGYTDNQEAATFGIAKKYKDFLINGTITSEDNHTSFGFGLNWKVK